MKKDEKDKKEKKLLMGLIIIFVIALIALAITVIYINQNKDKNEKELPYTDLIKEMNYGNIEKIDTFESENGFVAINLNEGTEGKIVVSYTGTILMNISYIVFIVTLIVLLIIWKFFN